MTYLIILSESEAAMVAGPTTPGHALYPVPMADGRFALPLSVLVDPAHETRRDMLLFLPQEEIDPAVAWPPLPDE